MTTEKKTVRSIIYKVTADNTDMVRYISGEADYKDRKVITQALAQLRSTEASSIGNAAKIRINPCWREHRRLFLKAESHKVEAVETHDDEGTPKRKQHRIAELNRQALEVASRNKEALM